MPPTKILLIQNLDPDDPEAEQRLNRDLGERLDVDLVVVQSPDGFAWVGRSVFDRDTRKVKVDVADMGDGSPRPLPRFGPRVLYRTWRRPLPMDDPLRPENRKRNRKQRRAGL